MKKQSPIPFFIITALTCMLFATNVSAYTSTIANAHYTYGIAFAGVVITHFIRLNSRLTYWLMLTGIGLASNLLTAEGDFFERTVTTMPGIIISQFVANRICAMLLWSKDMDKGHKLLIVMPGTILIWQISFELIFKEQLQLLEKVPSSILNVAFATIIIPLTVVVIGKTLSFFLLSKIHSFMARNIVSFVTIYWVVTIVNPSLGFIEVVMWSLPTLILGFTLPQVIYSKI